MYELNNRIRLICVPDYYISNSDEFFGFISGIISQDHDLEQMYFDSFLDISGLKGKDISDFLQKLDKLSREFNVDFVLSVSMDAADLPESARELLLTAL